MKKKRNILEELKKNLYLNAMYMYFRILKNEWEINQKRL